MSSKIWDVVVVGGANYDYLIRGPALPKPGDTLDGKEFQAAPGGKGANQAVAAARLGAHVALLTRLGRDERGDAILKRLTEERVDTPHLVRDSGAATGVALVHVTESGEKQILVAPGANHRLTVDDVNKATSLLEATRILLVQLEVPLESIETAIGLARAAGAQVVLDPSPPRPLSPKLLRSVDLIKPNRGEAQSLTGVKVQDRTSAREAAHQLLQQGVGAVAIQAGEEGDLLIWHEGEAWLPRLPVESVDATGAGDAFAAALAVALAEGRSLSEAGPFASAAAALTTTKLGAQAALPERQEVLDLMAKG